MNDECWSPIIERVNEMALDAISRSDVLSLYEAFLHLSHRIPLEERQFLPNGGWFNKLPWLKEIPPVTRYLLSRYYSLERSKKGMSAEAIFSPYLEECRLMGEEGAVQAFSAIRDAIVSSQNHTLSALWAFCDRRASLPSVLPGSLIMATQICADRLQLNPDYTWGKGEWDNLLGVIDSDHELARLFLSYALRLPMFSSPQRSEIFNFAIEELIARGVIRKQDTLYIAEFGCGPGGVIANVTDPRVRLRVGVDLQEPDVVQAAASWWPLRAKPSLSEISGQIAHAREVVAFKQADFSSERFSFTGEDNWAYLGSEDDLTLIISSYSLCQNNPFCWDNIIENMGWVAIPSKRALWLDVGMEWPHESRYPLRVFDISSGYLGCRQVRYLGTIGSLGINQFTLDDHKVEINGEGELIYLNKIYDRLIRPDRRYPPLD